MKYDELMDKIEVTDAMRARILRNVSAAAPKKTPVRRYALLAACLAVVLLGAVCVPKLMDPAPQGEQVAIANGMIEVADAAALADAVGFPAAEAAELPFDVEETTYTSYWGELAEICYAGGGQIADLRTSAGTEDNSGDYTDYPACEHLQGKPYEQIKSVLDAAEECGINAMDTFMSQMEVRRDIGRALRGRRERFIIQGHIGSVWTDGQYAYSLRLSDGQSTEVWQRLLAGVRTEG